VLRNCVEILGPAGESLRLAQHYREMSDEEIIELAQHPSELTELAQVALAQEVWSRRLKMPPTEAPAKQGRIPPPDESEESPYAEDRQLLTLCMVWSQQDAWQLQNLLDTAGIPFYMGPEKASSVDAVTSSFVQRRPGCGHAGSLPMGLGSPEQVRAAR